MGHHGVEEFSQTPAASAAFSGYSTVSSKVPAKSAAEQSPRRPKTHPTVADRASQKEFGLTSSTYCVFFVWLQARALSVSFLLPSVQHDLFCHVHVEAAALPRLMHSLH